MSHRYKPELAGERRLWSCTFSFWTFCSLLKAVCILLSSRMVTIVETWNIDIEGLDVTSAKQILPEHIMERMAFARFLPLRAVRKNVIKWVNFELKCNNWQELSCSQCKRLNLSWGWVLFNQEVESKLFSSQVLYKDCCKQTHSCFGRCRSKCSCSYSVKLEDCLYCYLKEHSIKSEA